MTMKAYAVFLSKAACFAVIVTLLAGVPADSRAGSETASADRFAGTDVGDVMRVRGNVAGLFQSLPRTLTKGNDVRFLETILTGTDSRVEIVLMDDSHLSIGDDAELTIDEMIYQPGKKGSGVLTLTKGVFRMVSGKINKQDGGTLILRTPIATIGVRGTDFWGHQEKNKLTMALIDHGSIEITGADGVTVVLDKPLQSVVLERGQPTPVTPSLLTPEQLAAAANSVKY